MRMGAEMKDINFALDLFLHSKLLNFGLVEYFHSNFVTGNAMSRKLHLIKRPTQI